MSTSYQPIRSTKGPVMEKHPTYAEIQGWSDERLILAWNAGGQLPSEDQHEIEEAMTCMYSELTRRGLEMDSRLK